MLTMKTVLIIGAMHEETALLEKALGGQAKRKTGPFGYVQGKIGNLGIYLCTSGVGKVNAAGATAAMIERCHPGLVINTGCAGAYAGSGLDIGGLAVASEEILGDEGVLTSAGWLDLKKVKMPYFEEGGQRYYNEIPLAVAAADKAMLLAGNCGIKLARGRFITVSTCSGTRAKGDELACRFQAISENMEGAAVALTCIRYGIDCLEIRGISNHVEERNMKKWDIPLAVETAQRFVIKYIEESCTSAPD